MNVTHRRNVFRFPDQRTGAPSPPRLPRAGFASISILPCVRLERQVEATSDPIGFLIDDGESFA